MDRLQYFFLALANKYAKILDKRHILVKEEKDGSYSRVIVDEEYPAVFKCSLCFSLIALNSKGRIAKAELCLLATRN